GQPLSRVLNEELAGPLGIAKELYFGMPRAEHGRLAALEDAPLPPNFQMPAMPPDLPMFKAAPMSLMPNAAFGNRPDTLGADIPAGGKTSARAIARMYAALIGDVDGVRLVSPAPCMRRRARRSPASTRSSECRPLGRLDTRSGSPGVRRRTRQALSAWVASAAASPSATRRPG